MHRVHQLNPLSEPGKLLSSTLAAAFGGAGMQYSCQDHLMWGSKVGGGSGDLGRQPRAAHSAVHEQVGTLEPRLLPVSMCL